MRLDCADTRKGFGIKVENHWPLFSASARENLNSLPPSAASKVNSGAASPGFSAAHAAVAKRPRYRERNRADGFMKRILWIVCLLGVDIMMLTVRIATPYRYYESKFSK